MIITTLLILNVLFWAALLLEAVIGYRTIARLENIDIDTHFGPLVSVIVAARDEEAAIVESLQSLFRQKYSAIEWIAVNDRSSDNTGQLLDNLTKENLQLKVIHIKKLPQGWLGKNHALYQGYQQSKGKYLLFTDADVIFHPETLSKALYFIQKQNVDHLTISPNLFAKGFWLQAFIAFFLFGFSFFKRPWRANVDHSKIGMGIGAFNLISREAYEKIGTHKEIAMRPDDDLQLGYQIKANGLRQRVVTGISYVKVTWYETLKDALIGLEKNTFAGLHYRVSMIFVAVIGTFLSHVLPFLTLFTTNALQLFLSITTILLIFLLYRLVTRRMTSFSLIHFIVFPLTALLFIYSILRASFLTFKRGGIVWRGTKYSLKELRKRQ
ncbi:glycosyltransferase [Cytobacillus luteolus]|uniref:glycosyltransferase n=1 Tax=Litchfieldia luteola TaxID=682179 RepID=UPI001CB0B1B5|nr:glycosyltransferase family 2 protein [Cytobacillus luteolus]MBP1942027.1 glycosyltransferase involved in cell wall biosynthesis [Cytobacillus luteolus]